MHYDLNHNNRAIKITPLMGHDHVPEGAWRLTSLPSQVIAIKKM